MYLSMFGAVSASAHLIIWIMYLTKWKLFHKTQSLAHIYHQKNLKRFQVSINKQLKISWNIFICEIYLFWYFELFSSNYLKKGHIWWFQWLLFLPQNLRAGHWPSPAPPPEYVRGGRSYPTLNPDTPLPPWGAQWGILCEHVGCTSILPVWTLIHVKSSKRLV